MQKLQSLRHQEAIVISLLEKESTIQPYDRLAKKLIISLSEGHRFIHHDDIIRLEGSSNYTKVYTRSGKTYMVSKTMKSVSEKLSKSRFVRVHRSHIIKVDSIELLAKDHIVMTDQSSVPISRANKKMIHELLGIGV